MVAELFCFTRVIVAIAEDMCVLLERTGGTERALMEQQVGADQECNRSNSNVHQAAQQAPAVVDGRDTSWRWERPGTWQQCTPLFMCEVLDPSNRHLQGLVNRLSVFRT